MIRYEWLSELDPPVTDELVALLDVAARDDAEPGFPVLSVHDHVEPGTRHLLVWLLPDEREAGDSALNLVAYLRLEPPTARSRGISTLLFEKLGPALGLFDGDALPVEALQTWARGSHPAAHRLSLRFQHYGVEVRCVRWQMLAPLRTTLPAPSGKTALREQSQTDGDALSVWHSVHRSPPPESASVLTADCQGAAFIALWIDEKASEMTDYGAAARLVGPIRAGGGTAGADDGRVRDLLLVAMRRLLAAGFRVASIAVDPQDRVVVHEVRSLGFMHDRTDVLYAVPNVREFAEATAGQDSTQ